VAVGVAGSARDGAPVDTAGDELGDHEVPQIVEAGAYAETGRKQLEAMGDPVGAGRLAAVRLLGEHIGVRGQARPDGQCGLDLPQAIGLDELHRVATDGHSALGVGLGVLVDQRPACDSDHAAGDEDLAVIQVDIAPLEAAELAAARPEDYGQAQEEAEFRILVPCQLE